MLAGAGPKAARAGGACCIWVASAPEQFFSQEDLWALTWEILSYRTGQFPLPIFVAPWLQGPDIRCQLAFPLTKSLIQIFFCIFFPLNLTSDLSLFISNGRSCPSTWPLAPAKKMGSHSCILHLYLCCHGNRFLSWTLLSLFVFGKSIPVCGTVTVHIFC